MQSLLRKVFQQHATRPAVQGRSILWTYAELADLSAALAQALLALGVRPGQTLPLLMARSPLMVLAQLALVRIGIGYSPLDMSSPAVRRRAMLDAIGSNWLLTDASTNQDQSAGDARLFDVAAWLRERNAQTATQNVAGASAELATACEVWLAPPDKCPAYIMFTSGSTGTPKGVMVPHAGIVRLVVAASYAHFGPEQRWGFLSSPAFDLSTLEVWGALLNGACCVVQEEAQPSLDRLGEFLIEQRITDTWLTSALFNAMVEDQLPALRRLRQLLVGGERVSSRHARWMLQEHQNVRLINGYGPTENTTFTLCHTITLADTEAAAGIPIGTAIAGTQVRVDPADLGQPNLGELWTAGAGVALGYLGDAELTERKFVWHEGVRWYRTGDLVRQRPDGVFEFHGRLDRQIKLRGNRIELEEVELALTRCPGVGNGAVLVLGDIADERRIVALYSLLDASATDEAQIAEYLRSILPAPAVPGELVQLEQLPMNLSGKVDRQALAALLTAGRLSTVMPPPATLLERWRRMARVHSERSAIEGEFVTLSYGELDRRSGLLAAHICAMGVGPGDHVALCLPRSPVFIIAVLACVRIGAAYAPIDLDSPSERITRMLDVLKPQLTLADAVLEFAGPQECTRRRLDPSALDWNAPFLLPAEPRSDPALPACIFFTSGSTGFPKAVMVTAAGIERLVRDDKHVHFSPEQRWAFLSSPAFDASTLEMWGPLLNGAACIVQQQGHPSLEILGQFLFQQHITDAWLTAGLFNAMVEDQLPALGFLRQLLVGGERLSSRHARQMLQGCPGTRLINGYGPTENTTFTLCHSITLADTESAFGVPIGVPVPETRIRIEPRAGGQHDPAGEGELWISGTGVALGYYGDLELTLKKFVWHEGVRWYRSGDLVRLRADGVCEFLGRLDRQVKLQGHRVEMDEVDMALGSCPGVGQRALILRGAGAASQHLVACFCSDSGAPVEAETVARHLAALLPAAAMPKVFRCLQRLPLNLNGKVDRLALEQLLDADEQAQAHGVSAEEALLSASEVDLAAIWRELLPHARLGPDAHFLRIGGTSLLALHVAALVAKRLGRQISPVDVLRHPMLCDQARVVAQSAAAPNHVHQFGAAQFKDWPIPLTRLQHNLLAASQLDPSACAYLVHVALHVAALPRPEAWRAAFEQLAQRHPALRLLAQYDDTVARARLLDALPQGWWQQHPLLAQAPRDLTWCDDLLALLNRPLDTGTQGAMRVDYWPVQGGAALLVWTVHHHVIDEASIATALTELDALLQKRVLQPVYGSAFAFQAVETAWSDRPSMAVSAARIAAALKGQAMPLEPAPAVGHEAPQMLNLDLQQRLKDVCLALGCTPFPVLLTAFGLALQDVFGAPFRFVSTPFSRRCEPELIEPIGCLLDVRFIEAGALPLEMPAQTLARVANAVREAQKTSFQPADALIHAVALIDIQAAQCLTQFGFTWRLNPARSVLLAGQVAELIRAPQVGARYSICLHVAELGSLIGCSIEAVESAWQSGAVEQVWRAFVYRLAALSSVTYPGSGMGTLGAETPSIDIKPDAVHPVAPNPLDAVLRRVWSLWARTGEQIVTKDSHFLRSGGSSLAAMRMGAELRRDHGVRLDVSAFLAQPTFARLSSLCQSGPPSQPQGYILVGPAEFSKVMLLLPGAGGHMAGMYALADELQARLPAGTAVAIVDLHDALQSAPQNDLLWFILRRIVQVVRDLGLERMLGIVGFSMGGAFALRVAAELDSGLPVWLLDTFAPRITGKSFWRRLERQIAWSIFGGRPSTNDVTSSNSASESAPDPLQWRISEEQWLSLGVQLAQGELDAPGSHVQLIQARLSVMSVGLLWQRRNNGFVPNRFASWKVCQIDGAHLDIPKHLAASTAAIIAAHVQFDASDSS